MDSGIFLSNKSNQNCGGVHSFYDEKKSEFAFLYPEITGYFASTMRFLYEHDKNTKFVEFAKSSSQWLIDIYKTYGGIIQGIRPETSPQKFVYSFDTGICVKGLLDCYSISKDKKYLDYANIFSNWIVDETISDEGYVKPLKNLETNEFEENDDVWYKRSGCLHIKLAIPLLQIYKHNHDDSTLDAAKKICDSISKFQNSDGSISLHKNEKVINIHTLCYALEGLIFAYEVTKDSNYLSCCKKAITWCDNKIDQEDGSIDLWFNSKYHSKSSYPVAQLIRLKILLAKIEGNDMESIIEKLTSFLVSLQAKSNDPKINGGFYEEFSKSLFGWKKTLKVNSWASMFSLQALYWLDNFENIEFEKEVELLY